MISKPYLLIFNKDTQQLNIMAKLIMWFKGVYNGRPFQIISIIIAMLV